MNNKSKLTLLLTEQIIMAAVFLLAAAVCIQAFVWSAATARECSSRDMALSTSASVAELFKAAKGDSEKLAAALISEANPGEAEAGDGPGTGNDQDICSVSDDGASICIGYDEDWNMTALTEAAFIINVELTEGEGVLVNARIAASDGENQTEISAINTACCREAADE